MFDVAKIAVSDDVVKSEGSISLRMGSSDNTTGMRFISSINRINRQAATEYGYIVTRKTFLEKFDGELTFNFKTSDGTPLYVYGKNHEKNSDGTVVTDKVFESLADGVKFSGVITGLNTNDPTQVCEVMVARPYAKFVIDGQEQYVYGAAECCSLQEIASYLRDNEKDFYEANKDFLDKLADMKK